MVIIELDWYHMNSSWEELDWEKFSACWPYAPAEKPASPYHMERKEARLADHEIEGLNSLGIQMKVKPLPGAMIVKMQDREKWDHEVDINSIKDGRAVQISIPDLGLMYIDEVTYLVDECTEQLQSYLDDGWRLLAVCPLNAQRRPDYILGRRKDKTRG